MATVVNIVSIVLAVVSVAASVTSAIIARRALGNAAEPPDLRKHPTSDEGNAAAWVFGPFNRVSGQVIYMSQIDPVPVPGSQKGKDDLAVVWTYKCDVAIAWCRNECFNPEPVSRIWASSELIFSPEALFTIPIASAGITPEGFWGPLPGPHDRIPGGSIYCRQQLRPTERIVHQLQTIGFIVPRDSDKDNDLRVIKNQSTNVVVTVTGTNNPVNSGTFTIFFMWSDYDMPLFPTETQWEITVIRCTYDYPTPTAPTSTENCTPSNPSCMPGVFESTPLTMVITVTGFSLYFPPGGITHYPGSGNQTIDPTIASDPAVPANSLPAYRGTCYTVIRSLDITKWASTLPHFEAEVRTTDAQPLVKDAFDAVIARNEATTEYKTDTSELSLVPIAVLGLQVLGPIAPSATLNTLMQIYDVEAQERLVQTGFNRIPENVLFFVPRESIPVNVIDYDLTSARETGSDGRVHALVKRTTKDDLPNEFVLEYTEFERDLQPGNASYTVSTGGVRNTQKLTIPIVNTQPGADVMCRTMLWKAINFHDTIEFNLSPKHYGITEGDRLRLDTPSDGLPIQCRVAQITIGENGLLEIDGQIDDDLAYDQNEGGGYTDPDNTNVVIPGLGQIIVMDIAPLAVGEVQRFGLYVVNHGLGRELNDR